MECLLETINEQKDSRGNKIALPALFEATPDQELFWKKVLSLCGQRLLNIEEDYSEDDRAENKALKRLRTLVSQSRIIVEEKIYTSGILTFTGRPIVCDFTEIYSVDPGFAEELQYFAAAIQLLERGKSPVVIS